MLAHPGRFVLVLQHVPWERPGLAGTVARELSFELLDVEASSLEAGDGLASVTEKAFSRARSRGLQIFEDAAAQDVAALVVMGGPMSVYEQRAHPWIASELRVIEEALLSGIPVLGVCLGAQMMAAALGAEVYRGEHGPEIGFGSARLTREGRSHPVLGAAGIEELPVFHWHRDTFEIPGGCVRLAESSTYPNQAFGLENGSLALQFHLEVDSDLFDDWLEHLHPEIRETQARAAPTALPEIERVGRQVFTAFFESLGGLDRQGKTARM